MSSRYLWLCAASIAALELAAANGALAQTAPRPTSTSPAASADVSEVIVTGTRLKSGFNEPTPVTVMSAEQLQARSPVSVGEALAQLPAFSGTRTTSSLGAVSSGVGSAQALLDLRGLGSNRVLVLLDGERLPASNVNGSVDVNVIPQALLERVDVVTGGASSSYGSDAVAGVVNFVLNHHFTGLKIDLSGGETTYGDAAHGHVTVAAGHAFLDGHLRLEGSAEYFKEDGIPLGNTGRGWYDTGGGFVTLPKGSATTFGLIPDARFSTMAYGGLITSLTTSAGKTVTVPGLSGMQFGPGGALQPFDFGTNTGTAFQTGGSGPRAANGMSPDQEREGFFFHGEYDVSDHVTGFVEAMYNRSSTDAISAYSFQQTSKAFRIYADNPYLPADVAALMKANNIASFTLGRYSSDIPPIENKNVTTLQRLNAGFRGDLWSGWSFDTSLAYAVSEQNYQQYNTINRNLYAAADAVVNPATGQIVCRSTLAGLDPGCVPLDVLGVGAASPAAAAYVSGWNVGDTTDQQTAFNLNVRGDLGDKISLGAGPINVAVGGAWRRDKVKRKVDALSAITTSCAGLRKSGCDAYNGVYGGYQSYNPGPLNGSVSVAEAYAEAGIPILKDKPLVRSLNLDLAGRITDYSTSGVTYTWKIGPTWDVTDELRIRATRSQDIRAPTANELFSTVSNSSTQTNNIFPSSTAPGPLTTTTTTLAVGNPDLKPEVAQTWTVGAVYKPEWLPGLEGSLDYYSINIHNAISTIATQTIIDNCFSGDQSACALITVGGKAVSTTAGLNGASGVTISNAPLNVASIKTTGVDAEVTYTTEVFGGNLRLRGLGNWVDSFDDSSSKPPNGPVLIGAYGVGAGLPRWTADLEAYYEHPLSDARSVSVDLAEHLIASGKYNPNRTDAEFPASQQHIPGVAYTNLTATYKFEAMGAREQLYVTVLNLFDKAPPAVPGPSTFQSPTRFDLYDVLGRRWTVGLKAQW